MRTSFLLGLLCMLRLQNFTLLTRSFSLVRLIFGLNKYNWHVQMHCKSFFFFSFAKLWLTKQCDVILKQSSTWLLHWRTLHFRRPWSLVANQIWTSDPPWWLAPRGLHQPPTIVFPSLNRNTTRFPILYWRVSEQLYKISYVISPIP